MLDSLLSFGSNANMWAVFGIIALALIGYATEKVPMEVTSFATICMLMLLFQIFPLEQDPDRMGPVRILQSLGNPALLTVLALLIMGEGIARTGILEKVARFILMAGKGRAWLSILLALAAVMLISAFMNNIPVVVIFIPIMRSLADRFGSHVGKVMIPLGYAAVLGGMMTLIGSSTNLIVNGAMVDLGQKPFGFFDFAVTGGVLAIVGLIYIVTVAPRLLPEREGLTDSLVVEGGTQFIAQLTVSAHSQLIGETAPAGFFKSLAGMTVRLVQRGEEGILPPFEDVIIQPGDVIIVAAPRKLLADLLVRDPGLLFPKLQDEEDRTTPSETPLDQDDEQWRHGEQSLVEAMVTPSSRMIGYTLTQIRFRYRTGCIVLGVQRKARMFRTRLTDIVLEPGDVLLIQGPPDDIAGLRGSRDVLLIEWSRQDLPASHHARRACLLFVGSLALAASGLLPIVVATMTGAVGMVALGVLNVRRAMQAIDLNVVSTIFVALALGLALYETGGAAFIARTFVTVMAGSSPAIVLSAFFLMLATLSNIISTKTTAVLFTPVAIDIARQLGVPHEAFTVAVIIAANCSYASPIGYQTNLLVMGPGHYRFVDFTRAGAPLILLLWAVFSVFAPWYYNLSG